MQTVEHATLTSVISSLSYEVVVCSTCVASLEGLTMTVFERFVCSDLHPEYQVRFVQRPVARQKYVAARND